jgi:hypothetical protein
MAHSVGWNQQPVRIQHNDPPWGNRIVNWVHHFAFHSWTDQWSNLREELCKKISVWKHHPNDTLDKDNDSDPFK